MLYFKLLLLESWHKDVLAHTQEKNQTNKNQTHYFLFNKEAVA